MKNQVLIILFILCSGMRSYSQYYRPENSTWRMGSYIGVDFTDTGLAARTSNMYEFADAGCASVADESGNLLFYTNGVSVWSANDSIMPHANPLEPIPALNKSQCALIVPTHHKGIYYLFTFGNGNGAALRLMCYTINMSLNNGWGDIDTSAPLYHIPVCDSISEQMIAVPGCNDNIWVLVKSTYSYAVLSIEVDAADSVHTVPVSSYYPYWGVWNSKGEIRASPLWDKVAFVAPFLATMHFDRATGQLSDYQVIDSTTVYTTEFSPNGQMLYAPALVNDSIFQYNLSSLSSDYNKTSIGTRVAIWNSIKLAPDSSIYMNLGGCSNCLARVKYPDSPGVACGFEDSVSNLTLYNPNYPVFSGVGSGLPNLVVFQVSEQDTWNLYLDTLLCTMPDTPVILTASPYYAGKVWSTGAVTDTIAVSEAGTYWVTYGNGCAQRVDTYKVRTILLPLSISYANGQLSTTNIFTTYQWYKDGNIITGATAQYLNAIGDGLYKVVVSNGNGCTDSAEYVLDGSSVGSINASSDISIYPNPAKDKVWIKCPVHCTVSVIGVDGKVYYEGLGGPAPLDVSSYSNGMYYVVLRDYNKALLAVRKLVVMR